MLKDDIKQKLRIIETCIQNSNPNRKSIPVNNSRILKRYQNEVQYKIMSDLTEFRLNLSKFTDKIFSKISTSLTRLLGIGEGSTPISDDILLGIFLTMYLTDPNYKQKFKFLSQVPFQNYTTKNSAHFLRRILRGNFPEEIIPFYHLLISPLNTKKRILDFQKEIKKILSIGTSSGLFFLHGSLWELKFSYDLLCLTL